MHRENHFEQRKTKKNEEDVSLLSLFAPVQSVLVRFTLIVLMISLATAIAYACGGCFRLPYQSLLEKVERGDLVVVAHPADPTGSSWTIDRVIKGRKPNNDETTQADKLSMKSRSSFNGPHILRWNRFLDTWIIEDCARWQDWSFAPGLMEIYAEGKQPWNNAMIIKYLEVCPLPAAKQFLNSESVSDNLRTAR
jgi:hypothetical protein